jgi:hypothetical protein
VFPFHDLQGLRRSPNESLMGIATRLIFPKWPTWIQQRESQNGDQSKCSANFLYELLPWLAAIVIQDGIFWIVDFPGHEVSRLLLHAMPPWYPRWAASARRECRAMTANQQQDKINAMNEGSRAAFALLMEEVKHMRRDVLQLRNENKLLREEMQRQAAEYKRRDEERYQQVLALFSANGPAQMMVPLNPVPPLPFRPVAQVAQQPQLHSAAPATRPNVNKVL